MQVRIKSAIAKSDEFSKNIQNLVNEYKQLDGKTKIGAKNS